MSGRAAAAPRAVEHAVSDRWLRAFAAAVGDLSDPFFDLTAPRGIVAHPVFPVCLEWPLVSAGPPGYGLDPEAARAGLHVNHEIAWHRPIRPGEELRTTVALESVRARSVGTFVGYAFTTRGAGGAPVVESRQGVLYRGTELGPRDDGAGAAPAPAVAGEPRPDAPPPGPLAPVGSFAVSAADAVVYTECARIWNPIHTDPRAARAAGLPTTVYHGTATLARIVSTLLEHRLGGNPGRIRRLGCRFAAPVAPGERVTVAASAGAARIAFAAGGADGTTLVDQGFVELRGA